MAIRPTHAIILSAGLGTRMRPLTDRMPKPLVPVAGRTLLDRARDKLAVAGVGTCVVNVHYLADQIEAHVADWRGAPAPVISDERDVLLETGGGIVKALPLLGDEPFFLLNSDSTWTEGETPALERLASAWDSDRMDALLLLAGHDRSVGFSGAGDFLMDDSGRLERRGARANAPFAYAGGAILHQRLFAGSAPEPFSLNRLFDVAIAAGRLYGVAMDGTWLHVGTPDAVGEAEAVLAREAT
ncbi:nucleotidyltransferase family protein [Stappia sp.]|uniref:nucleotidyltransferase family protein n=1 Tax=Stappia sp. TaxID=1870903 RepID=UPI0025D1A452|nr:nucleotidyltransferase family protein [Stappia sp.]